MLTQWLLVRHSLSLVLSLQVLVPLRVSVPLQMLGIPPGRPGQDNQPQPDNRERRILPVAGTPDRLPHILAAVRNPGRPRQQRTAGDIRAGDTRAGDTRAGDTRGTRSAAGTRPVG